ncbi:MAG: HAMP domain-containing histidine kinase [Clostridia bacterium]|nr:HAMP domain-containing histidine kinase [Clostridia bacterium]
MKEQKIIHKQLIKNMFFNMILFSIIFSAFSFIIFTQLNSYLYVSVDKELKKCKDDYLKFADFKEEDGAYNLNIDKIKNPRITCVIRDEDGNLVNANSFGKNLQTYIKEIDFKKKNIDSIYEISINSDYFYRGTCFEVELPDKEKVYVELLVNVNSEKQMINNFAKTLSIGTGIVILLSIFVSYGLAVKAMRPIARNYRKQSEFIQNVSHELRTPLTIIHAKQEMLLQSPNSKIIDKSEDIALTLNETRRLSKMIKELMELARTDQEKIKLDKEKTDINSLIEETALPYSDMAKVQGKNIKFNLNCKKEIKVDRNRIKQLLIILLDNALKYTEKGDSIEIEAYNKDEKCFINIKDTGIGISDEGIKRVFERFYREDKARSRETGGTGLGLSIAYTIVNLHGGSIKIGHNKPKGTVVFVRV